MVLHAGLDTAAGGLHAWAGSLHIGLAGLDDGDAAQKRLLAGFRQLGEVLLDARSQAALAGLNLGATLLDFRPAGLTNRRSLRHGTGRDHEETEQDNAKHSAHNILQNSHAARSSGRCRSSSAVADWRLQNSGMSFR